MCFDEHHQGELVFLTSRAYRLHMTATITAKGQITIPLSLRKKLHLKVGDKIEFDENSPILSARRIIDKTKWKTTVKEWQAAAKKALKDHPWENQHSTAIIDDLRGGPAEPKPTKKRK